MIGEFDLIAVSVEALCGIRATGKYFLFARHSRASRLRVDHQGEKAYITVPDDWLDSESPTFGNNGDKHGLCVLPLKGNGYRALSHSYRFWLVSALSLRRLH
jgi:hypothetical protein